MAAFVVGLVLVLAMTGYSDASYCVCNSGVSDAVLQKNIDYACGAGADCTAIMQNGACFNPNTVKDHCNYAVNSYYQRKAQITGSCDFQGTAAVTQTAPSAAPGCVYQSSPSGGGGGGSTTPPGTGGTTPSPPGIGGTTPSPPGTFPGSPVIPGMGPTGSGFGNTDNSASFKTLPQTFAMAVFVVFFSLCLY
ncbi:hypothetical protein ABFS82_05G004600 [Erythranthe guttata]|uniref:PLASMODESMATA CALLOSE-BINDING PROTEIN 3-like n=1 Tax=Erythranthe guttata TaxID=4155 RepID=UPI00064D7CF5|nr:PREDICTED: PLASMODESMATA CALLOSE-BINDING PROTEIN 3-like [Erythranthe guttata]|eukprot:XP_012855420.1 PREDICTED: PLASMODESMATA CALLOSE-BINDING PROTEIN 3-like [Erythranthe guttata]